MNKTLKSRNHGISKQTYNYRIKNWRRAKLNNKEVLINKEHVLYLDAEEVDFLEKQNNT